MSKDPALIRLGCFLGILLACLAAETVFPRRRPVAPKGPRWLWNLSIMALDSLAVRLLLPLSLFEFSRRMQAGGIGLLNGVQWPWAAELAFSLIALDLVIYWQHRLFHRLPWLWRLHSVHHSDLDLDSSSGVRFHPIEILISLGIKAAAVAALGVAPASVVIFEVLLNANSVFNHANIALPADSTLRLFIVTPDMHRVHHTPDRREHDSNFSFNVPWWDWLFGSYNAQPRGAHETLELGLRDERDPRRLHLGRLLLWPLRKPS